MADAGDTYLYIYGTNIKAEYCFTVNSKTEKHVEEQEGIVTVVCESEKDLLQRSIYQSIRTRYQETYTYSYVCKT